MSILKKLAGQTAVYGLSTIVGRFLNFLLVPIYTNVFNPGEYGVITELYSYIVFLMIFLTYGMETGFFRFQQEKNNKNVYTTIISSLFTSSSIFIGLVFLFVKPISSGLGYEGFEDYILWMAIIIGVDAFTSVPFAKLRNENKAMRFAVIKLTNIAVNIGLNLTLIILLPALAKSHDIAWIDNNFAEPKVSYIFISNLVASLLTLVMLIPDIFRSHNKFDYSLLKQIFAYSWPILIAGLAGSINEVYDRISLRHFLTIPEGADQTKYILSQVGMYGANYKLAMIIAIFNQAFRFAAEPFFFSKINDTDSRQVYAKVMNYFVAFTLLLFLVITLYINIFKHFIGSDFHEGLHIVPILLIANVFLGIVFNLSIWYKLSNQTKYGIWIVGFGAVITLIINMIFVPEYGYVACAWATLACYLLMTVLSYRLCQRHYRIPYNLKSLGLYFALAGVLYFIDTRLQITSEIASYSFKTVLVGIYSATVYLNETKKLKFF